MGFAIFLIAAMGSAALASTPATVMVRPESEVVGPSACLGEIAGIQCTDSAPAEKLRNAPICSAPLPGKTRKITRDQIIIALRKAGIDDETVDLLCPEMVRISRKASTVSGQSLFETARAFALAANSWPGTVAVEPVRLPPDQTVPVGKLELRARAGAGAVRKGQNSLPVEIVIDGRVYRTVHTAIRIRVFAPVLVSTQAIPRSATVSAQNARLSERDITNLPDDVYLGNPSSGCVASVSISEGAVIRKQWLSEPAAIKSGDSVLVVVENGAIRVTDKATAVQDGRAGQRIKVRFANDGREVRGTVAEPGLVKISLPN